MKVLKIIEKNIKVLLRSKTSALVVVLGPLLVILLVGMAFNTTDPYKIRIGYYSPTYNEFTNSYIEKVKETYTTAKYESAESCIDDIKLGKVHTCIVFPRDLGIYNDITQEIIVHADYSKINLVYSVISSASEKVLSRSDEVSADLTFVLIDTLNKTSLRISKTKGDVQQLQKQNSELKKSLESMDKQLRALNLSFDESSFGISTLQSKVTALADTASEVKALGQNSVQTTEGLLENITILLEELKSYSNTTSSQSSKINSIISMIKSYNSTFKNISDAIANAANTTDELSGVQSSISTLNTKIGDVKKRMSDASVARDKTRQAIKDAVAASDEIDKLSSELIFSLDGMESNIASIKVTNVQSIVSPVKTTVKPVLSEKRHLSYLFPSLIALIVMFVSMLLASTIVVLEKNSKAYFRNIITPTSYFIFFLGSFLTIILILILQLAIMIGISTFLYKEAVSPVLLELIVILLLSSSLFTLIGMLIGTLFSSEDTATLAAISLSSVMLLVSHLILPIESMPAYVAELSKLNPFVVSDFMLKKALLFNKGFGDMALDIRLMVMYVAILLILVLWTTYIASYKVFSRAFMKFRMKKLRMSDAQDMGLPPNPILGKGVRQFHRLKKK